MSWASPTVFKPQKQLADQMGDLVDGGSAPHRHQPFPMDGPVDEGAQPQYASQMGMLLGDPAQVLMGKLYEPAGRERQDAVIHGLQQEAMEIHEVAWDVKGRDLSLAVQEELVAGHEALCHESALARPVSLPHDVVVRLNLPGPPNGISSARFSASDRYPAVRACGSEEKSRWRSSVGWHP